MNIWWFENRAYKCSDDGQKMETGLLPDKSFMLCHRTGSVTYL